VDKARAVGKAQALICRSAVDRLVDRWARRHPASLCQTAEDEGRVLASVCARIRKELHCRVSSRLRWETESGVSLMAADGQRLDPGDSPRGLLRRRPSQSRRTSGTIVSSRPRPCATAAKSLARLRPMCRSHALRAVASSRCVDDGQRQPPRRSSRPAIERRSFASAAPALMNLLASRRRCPSCAALSNEPRPRLFAFRPHRRRERQRQGATSRGAIHRFCCLPQAGSARSAP